MIKLRRLNLRVLTLFRKFEMDREMVKSHRLTLYFLVTFFDLKKWAQTRSKMIEITTGVDFLA